MRSTRSSTRNREGKSPARGEAKPQGRVKVAPDPVDDAIAAINGHLEVFCDSASEVQKYVETELQATSNNVASILVMLSSDKDGFEKLCSKVSQFNNKQKNCLSLMKAEKEWRKLMDSLSIPSLVKLNVQVRRDLCSAGRSIVAYLLFTGNIYPGLTILKEIVEINDYDPPSAVILMRWLVRSSEWEAMERMLDSDRKRSKSNFEGFEPFVELCEDILDFHRYPKDREEKAKQLMATCTKLDNTKDKTFQLYESQVVLYSALSLTSKVAGMRSVSTLCPLFCIDAAYQRAETLVRSRWTSFVFEKPLEVLKTKSENAVELLKCASSVAEYFDLLRLNVNEHVRCAILREPFQYASVGLCHAIRLGVPMWINQSLILILSTKLRSEAEKEEVVAVKKMIHAVFMKEKEEAAKEGDTSCIPHVNNLVDHLNKLSLSPEQEVHLPSSSCDCHLCLEGSFNPSFSFFTYKLSVMCSGYSTSSITSLIATYTRLRTLFAPYQRTLMELSGEKPRPPAWMCDEMGQSMVSFLLSPIGVSLDKKNSLRVEVITLISRICSYASQLCLPYKLIIKHLSRHQRECPSFPWMIRKSIVTKLADLSIGSEGRGRRTPQRTPTRTPTRATAKSPFTGLTLNTPVRKKPIVRDRQSEKEDMEEKEDYMNYGHLLYHDWRSRVCESLSLKTDDSWSRAMYMSETAAVATREARRLIDGKMEPFGFLSVDMFKGAVTKMPTDMTVNQLIVTMSGDLFFIKIHSTTNPIVIPLAKESKWSLIMDGFTRAMNKSDESAQAGKGTNDAKKYWEGRRKAEDMMRRAMMDMESELLGAFAPLFLPTRKLTQRGDSVARSVMIKGEGGMKKELAREMVAVAAQTNHDQFKALAECMCQLEGWSVQQMDLLLGLQKRIDMNESSEWLTPLSALPFVFFVLSTELARCPWEAVSILKGKAHCSRLLSIHQLFSLIHSFNKVPYSANPNSAFYILDPANDLAATKNRLTPVVETVPSWKGVTGKGPDKAQIASIIKDNDFFIFLGHGNGLRYLSRSLIRKSRCKAVILLMGCSSVYTVHEGRGMDGRGAVLDYSVASCPCIVGCIYTVTDGEIDKYFTALVNEGLAKHLKEQDSSPSSELRLHLEAMSKARKAVKLEYLTGSTVVSYGIPIDIRDTSTC